MCAFARMLARKIAPKIFSLFQTLFSFFKQIKKKMGWKVFKKPSTPFFYLLNFIGVGGDVNLKNYLARP